MRLVLRSAPSPVTDKEEGFERDVKKLGGGWAIRRNRSSKGRSFHADGPATPYFREISKFPPILVLFRFLASPILTIMHLRIML